jgi:hypothetical protein
MRFRSEREQELTAKVIRQMITLVESLLQRMVPIQTEAELQGSEAVRLLLDAICMQYPALSEAVMQLDKLTGNTLQDQFPEQD